LLFYLSGPMIFGLSKAIAREHNAMKDADVLVMDLSDVPMLGVTASLAIENAIRDACDKGLQVYIAGASTKIQSRLESLGLFDLIKAEHIVVDRTTALRLSVASLHTETSPDLETGTQESLIPTQIIDNSVLRLKD